MSLAFMYQRIPYSTLSDISKKKPQNYAILKLPPSPNDRIAFAAWERKSNAETTTTFDEARVTGYGFKDTSFAKWETRTFPKDIDFESALERIEKSNAAESRVLKYKLNFTDGCHILLTRKDVLDPSTLFCAECYNPNGSFNKKTMRKKDEFAATEGKRRAKFLVNESGHLKGRKRDENGDPLNNTFSHPPPQVGKAGYTFTPTSYLTHEVKPNLNFHGVRPGLKETNKSAHQFLRKDQVV
eukprot:CAMPEP_0174281860 /NCGR_PEP_ID=MMETSP0809-20121228/2279_1 /TAXON_ID=73025 ORGANISM="Eutreptiella gymnastica-like, Strain CCMP1594" /NCGR_SAMPLE_ID=MMETSP0809 /ASSEMBLY_ACC=CAM_ASM_000658 /LENGTH=240 /DNA_ID=CAMNT_0015375689 /DNA_START=46 /DNA_END=768 /DNA_ORIENTATION=+